MQWATFRELLENETSRRIIGFGAFGEFPCPNSAQAASDKEFASNWNARFKDVIKGNKNTPPA